MCSRDSDCAASLVCRFGSCRTECTANRDCPIGARCLLAGGLGSCSLESDEHCESGGNACASGLTCLGDRCVNTCATASDCPPDAACSPVVGAGVSFCFATGRDDAGPGEDAAMVVDAHVAPDGQAHDASLPDAAMPDAGGRCGASGCGSATGLCVGDSFACAVRDADNHVLCWGRDDEGQLGNGTDNTTPHFYTDCTSGGPCSPRAVEVLSGVDGMPIAAHGVACSANAACAWLGNSVWCWGSNSNGELGRSAGTASAARGLTVTLPSFPGMPESVLAMRSAFCARSSVASHYEMCWGDDVDDVFGVGLADTVVFPTHAMQWDGDALALGHGHICGIDSAGAVSCDGNYRDGELGAAYVMSPPSGRASIAFPGAVGLPSALVAAAHFSAVILDDQVWTWGSNAVGSLGRTTAGSCLDGECDPVPAVVTLPEPTLHLWASGFDDMICAQSDTHTWCWGGTDMDGCFFAGGACDAPVSVPALEGAIAIAGGARSLCAIDGTGEVICFGGNASGQLGNGHSTSLSIAFSDAPSRVCIADDCP